MIRSVISGTGLLIVLCVILFTHCRPKFRIKGDFVNETRDTLISTLNGSIDTILPASSFKINGVWDRAYPKKNFKCCPCELGFDRMELRPVNKKKTLTKDIGAHANWTSSTEDSRRSRVIKCSFIVREQDIVQ